MGYFAALAITLFLAAFVRITVINGGVQRVIYFPCTHGTKSVLNLGTQHYKTQQKLVETISFNELLSALFRMQISAPGRRPSDGCRCPWQLHGALDAQPFTTGGQGAIINPTDRSVGKEREHFHAEIQR